MVCSSPGVGLVPYPVELAIFFKKQGHEVHAMVGSLNEFETGLKNSISENGINLHMIKCLDSKVQALLPIKNELIEILKKIDPDVTHFWGPRTAFQGRKISYQKNVARIIMIGSMGHTKGKTLSVRFAAHIANNYSDKVLALCEQDAERLRKVGVDSKKLGVMHFPVCCSKYNKLYFENVNKFRRDQIFDLYKLPKNKKILGCFAWFHQHKGHEIAIKAFIKIAEKYSNWNFVLAGDGETLSKCIELSKKLPNRIHFIGRIKHENVMELMPFCNSVVHPSFIETFGFSMLEPLLFEIPTVMTRVGIAEEINRARVAVVVEPRSVTALIEGLCKIFDNEVIMRDMAKQGRKFVLNNFDTAIIGNKLLKLYKDLVYKSN